MIKLEFNEHEIMNEIVDKFDVSSEAELEDIKTRKTLKNRLQKPLIVKHSLSSEDYNRIIEMAWQDRTHFDVIQVQYGLNENEIKKLMRRLISAKAFKRWRKRVQGRKTKHKKQCEHKPTRFQGPW